MGSILNVFGITVQTMVVALYLFLSPVFFMTSRLYGFLLKAVKLGIFAPIMLALCLIAYCILGVVGWVMDFCGGDSE